MLASLMISLLPLVLSAVINAQETPQSTEPTSQPATRPATPADVDQRPRQAEIYEALLEEKENPARILPQDPSVGESSSTADAAADSSNSLLPEGVMLIDRPGRLIVSESGSSFRFTAIEGKPELPSMEILKTGLLEAMERDAELGFVQFYITAEVTLYRGENFLLLHKLRRQVPNGNLNP